MGIRFPSMVTQAKQMLKQQQQSSLTKKMMLSDVPKGYLAVYVGSEADQMKRFIVPISYLNHPAFQDLLVRSEEEFGFNHPMGGLTIPCREEAFLEITSRLSHSW
ncbi:auxin-induced protein 15A-like [Impatiens glandulifera]|uniref:auxin-induced protein 15A-like n=1 Tax=Impatiens glandulifera TaxID=253017 RepID=UPI001FB15432|nr:auxin-induced protein 15A-like [Impatiens glandulifera]